MNKAEEIYTRWADTGSWEARYEPNTGLCLYQGDVRIMSLNSGYSFPTDRATLDRITNAPTDIAHLSIELKRLEKANNTANVFFANFCAEAREYVRLGKRAGVKFLEHYAKYANEMLARIGDQVDDFENQALALLRQIALNTCPDCKGVGYVDTPCRHSAHDVCECEQGHDCPRCGPLLKQTTKGN